MFEVSRAIIGPATYNGCRRDNLGHTPLCKVARHITAFYAVTREGVCCFMSHVYPGDDIHNAGPTATGVNLKDMGPRLKETQTEIWILISCHLWCDLGKTNWSHGLQVRVGSTQNGTTSQLKTVIILTIMLSNESTETFSKLFRHLWPQE